MEGQIGQHIQFNLIELHLIKNIFLAPYNINYINVLTHINELGSGVKINMILHLPSNNSQFNEIDLHKTINGRF